MYEYVFMPTAMDISAMTKTCWMAQNMEGIAKI